MLISQPKTSFCPDVTHTEIVQSVVHTAWSGVRSVDLPVFESLSVSCSIFVGF